MLTKIDYKRLITGQISCCWKPLRATKTSHSLETLSDTRVNSPGHGKTLVDWAISSVTS